MESPHDEASLARLLSTVEAGSPVEAVEAVTRELGAVLDARSVSLLLADLSGRALVRLTHVPFGAAGRRVPSDEARRHLGEEATALPFDGGPEERAVRTQTVQVVRTERRVSEEPDDWRVLAPVTERGESIGVLELLLPAEPDARALGEIGLVAHLLSFVVIAGRRHTDLFEWGQRSRPFTLSAEIQQRLLPGPRTCEASAFTLSAWLEPAASIGGDTFDYSLARDVLHLSVTDAMGHGVAAALTATLGVSGLRNARRVGASLRDQVTTTNEAMARHAAAVGLDDFVTGLVGRVDLDTGVMELVNAGHVPPYLIRGDEVSTVVLPVDAPLGLFDDTDYRSTAVELHPGDRFVIVTDGMLELGDQAVDIGDSIRRTRDLHPREAVRMLADAVLEATGHALRDDATVLCLDWHGSHGDDRDAVHGADVGRASAPLD